MKSKDIPNIFEFIHKSVKIITNKNILYEGVLSGHDAFLNVLLDQNESYMIIQGDSIKEINLL